MDVYSWIAIIAFVTVFILISFELINKAIASLAGAALFMILGIVKPDQGYHAIDWSVVIFLVSMMILVSLTKRSGVFEFIAIKTAKFSKGDPIRILVLMSVITALSASLLGTVATVLILSPVFILIAVELAISPVPFLIVMALCANLGGAATLIGDPTSILIGSSAKFGFLEFVLNNGFFMLILLAVILFILSKFFKKKMVVSNERKARIMEFNTTRIIRDKPLLIKCLITLAIVVLGFVFGAYVGLQAPLVALCGCLLLLLASERHDIDKVLLEVEWSTILFFVGLFIMVLGLENLGLIDKLATIVIQLTGGNLLLTAILIIWVSAVASAFVDNIPYVIAMIPLIENLSRAYGTSEVAPLWWALSLGAVLGGNATLIGASANVVTAGIAGKSGIPISFASFARLAVPLALVSLVLATGYIYIRYFLLR